MNTKKAKNSAAKSKGRAKALVGRLTGNKSLRAEGTRDQVKATVRQAGQKIKDAAKK
ncbi:MAG TPA: CsbD family protein [Actinospica sp.]|nr:CsbD family protein [Actinospica sp.]